MKIVVILSYLFGIISIFREHRDQAKQIKPLEMRIVLARVYFHLLCKYMSHGLYLKILIDKNGHLLLFILFQHCNILNFSTIENVVFVKLKTRCQVALFGHRHHFLDRIVALISVLAEFGPVYNHLMMKRTN